MIQQAYTYTDLQIVFKIDPIYCTGTIYAGFEPAVGTPIEITSSDMNPETGEILISLTQAQTEEMHGVVAVQLNGFLNGARWASEKCYFRCGNNTIRRILP